MDCFAERHRDRERFLLGIGRLDHADFCHRSIGVRAEDRIRGALLP